MKNKGIRTKKIVSTVLIMAMMLSVSGISMLSFANEKAAEEKISDTQASTETAPEVNVDIHIRTADDFEKFAAACSDEAYSEGKTVSLDGDIDLSGGKFMPVPSFGGTFLGNGHTISNFTCASNGSHQGLFRYVTEKGQIINLKVTGDVSPNGSKSAVGGIAGTNNGFIGNCTFSGNVEGMANTGGIAGENYGVIKDCTTEGSVLAKHFSGGITGFNTGSVGYCVNKAGVNNEIIQDTLDIKALEIDKILGRELVSNTKFNSASDIGGICGINTGIVKACENSGTIGYQHYGFNVGGIAGRQSGHIADSVNKGEVLGREDVGGVVGQMTPFLILQDSTSVDEELAAMKNATDAALANLDSNSKVLGDNISNSAVYGMAISDRYYDTSGTVKKVKDGTFELTPDDLKNKKGSGIEGKAGEVFDKTTDKATEFENAVGTETIDNVTSGNVSDQDKTNLQNAAGLSGDTPRDIINNKKAEREAQKAAEEAEQAKQLEAINNAIKSGRIMGDNFTSAIQQLSSDLAGISEHYNKILGMIANAISGNFELTVMHDISDEDEEGMKDGKVEGCSNEGKISADVGAGGIIGTMGSEVDFDIDKILSKGINDTISISTATYYCRNIVTDCLNDGEVEGRKENIGGVVGLCEIGNIVLSQNYGNIKGSGRYYGGIAGLSKSKVKKCFSMCALEGTEYIGGITGKGKYIDHCSSIVDADITAACCGAVSGWMEFAESDTYLDKNYFVSDELGGVDGISYDGLCQKVTYEDLLSMNALPDKFRSLKLTFMADGEEVKVIEFTYGDSLDPNELPAVPEKDGTAGVCQDFDFENMKRSAVIEAQYNARQNIIASKDMRKDSPMSVALAEGAFSNSTELSISKYSGSAALPSGSGNAYEMKLKGSFRMPDEYTLRWNTGGKDADIYVLTDGKWKSVAYKKDGSFCVFKASGNENAIFVAERTLFAPSSKLTLSLIVAVLLAAVAARFLVLKAKNRKAIRLFGKSEEEPA